MDDLKKRLQQWADEAVVIFRNRATPCELVEFTALRQEEWYWKAADFKDGLGVEQYFAEAARALVEACKVDRFRQMVDQRDRKEPAIDAMTVAFAVATYTEYHAERYGFSVRVSWTKVGRFSIEAIYR